MSRAGRRANASLPILGRKGVMEMEFEHMTPDDWHRENPPKPLGPWGVIHDREETVQDLGLKIFDLMIAHGSDCEATATVAKLLGTTIGAVARDVKHLREGLQLFVEVISEAAAEAYLSRIRKETKKR